MYPCCDQWLTNNDKCAATQFATLGVGAIGMWYLRYFERVTLQYIALERCAIPRPSCSQCSRFLFLPTVSFVTVPSHLAALSHCVNIDRIRSSQLNDIHASILSEHTTSSFSSSRSLLPVSHRQTREPPIPPTKHPEERNTIG